MLVVITHSPAVVSDSGALGARACCWVKGQGAFRITNKGALNPFPEEYAAKGQRLKTMFDELARSAPTLSTLVIAPDEAKKTYERAIARYFDGKKA